MCLWGNMVKWTRQWLYYFTTSTSLHFTTLPQAHHITSLYTTLPLYYKHITSLYHFTSSTSLHFTTLPQAHPLTLPLYLEHTLKLKTQGQFSILFLEPEGRSDEIWFWSSWHRDACYARWVWVVARVQRSQRGAEGGVHEAPRTKRKDFQRRPQCTMANHGNQLARVSEHVCLR